jgi:hypothetical protein
VLELLVSLEPFLLYLLRRLSVKHVGEAGRNQVIVNSERLRLLLVVMVGGFLRLLLVVMVGGFNVAAVVGAEDVGFRVLLLLLLLLVRAGEGDGEVVVGLSSQLLAADSGDSTGSLPLAELIAAPTKWGDALLAWTIWRTAASSLCSGTETLLV